MSALRLVPLLGDEVALVVTRPDGEPTDEDFVLAAQVRADKVLVLPVAQGYLDEHRACACCWQRPVDVAQVCFDCFVLTDDERALVVAARDERVLGR